MGPRRDPIAVVEACYDLGPSEEEWLLGLTRAVEIFLAPPFPVIGYRVESRGEGMHLVHAVQSRDGEVDIVSKLREIGGLLEEPEADELTRTLQRVWRGGIGEPAAHLLMSQYERQGPEWMYSLGVSGAVDQLSLRSRHLDELGCTSVVCGLRELPTLRKAETELLLMLGAHITAGLRLRRQLGEGQPFGRAPEDGAILDGEARLVHAEGEACEKGARAELRHAARDIDWARSARSGRDRDAVAIWRGLVQGRWSLVEHFDSDGKRFIVAHKNPENVVDPRALGEQERRVVGLAAHGHSNKLIAYHLGVASSTVATHLRSALRKLGLGSRDELVRVLGSSELPAPDEREN